MRTSNIDHKKNSKVYHVIFQNNIKVAIHQLFNNLTVTEVIQRVWRKTCMGLGDWLYKHDSQDSIFFSFFACVCSSFTQEWKKVFEMFSNYYHTGNSSSVDLKNSPYGYFPKRDCSSGERCVLSLELMDSLFSFSLLATGEIPHRPIWLKYCEDLRCLDIKYHLGMRLDGFLWICPFRLHESYCPNWCKWSSSVSGLFFYFRREESNTFDLSVGPCCGHRLRLWAIGSNGDTSSWNEFSL